MKKLIILILVLGMATCLHAQKTRFRAIVLPLANQSNQRGVQEKTAFDSTTRYTDRFSVMLRSEIENWFAGQEGVELIDRAELDDMVKEMSAQNQGSGAVFNESTVVQWGQQRGANYKIGGAILQISRQQKKFEGYNTSFNVQTDIIRFRLQITDIGQGSIPYSHEYSIKLPVVQTKYGVTEDSDIVGTLAEQVSSKLDEDEKLQAAIQKLATPAKRPVPASNAGTEDKAASAEKVDVTFSPIPDNCDVEIAGVLLGTSPVTVKLPEGQQVTIDIKKAGYEPWQKRILVSKGMKLSPELSKLQPQQPQQ